MNKQTIRQEFNHVENFNDAPYQPLTLLYVLGHYWKKGGQLLHYAVEHKKLHDLLSEYAFLNAKKPTEIRPYYPTYYLSKGKTARIWLLKNIKKGEPTHAKALREDWQFGIQMPVYQAFLNDRSFLLEIIFQILREKIDKTLHLKILHDIGVPNILAQRTRFVLETLNDYEHRCAVCPDMSHDDSDELIIKVAHIKPWFYGGQQDFPNSIAMCKVHRDLYYFGGFSINEDYQIIRPKYPIVYLNKEINFENLIRTPNDSNKQPNPELLRWHEQNIFRSQLK